MSAPGQPILYFTLENNGFYYRGYGQSWSSHLHFAVALSEELAEKLQRRYPQATIEQQAGYDVNPKEHLGDVGEPEAAAALSSAVKLAARDGMSLETILVQTEKIFHENERQSGF